MKSGLAACESSLFAALLCGTAAALGVVSGLSLLAALPVDACECPRAPEEARLSQAKSERASGDKDTSKKGLVVLPAQRRPRPPSSRLGRIFPSVPALELDELPPNIRRARAARQAVLEDAARRVHVT